MMEKFKYKPLELGNMTNNEVDGRVDVTQKYGLTIEQNNREGTLAQIMPELNKK